MFNTTRRVLQSLVFMLLISLPTLIYAQEISVGREAKGAWSPDGRYIAQVTRDGHVYLMDIFSETYELMYQQEGGFSQLFELALSWSPDSARLAATDEDSKITIWDVAMRQRLWSTDYPSKAVSWSPDGSKIAVLTSRNIEPLSIIDTTTWEIVAGTYIGVYDFDMAWSPDGQKIAIGSLGLVEWFDANTLTLLHRSATAILPELTIAWSPDSNRIASANSDGSLRIRNAADGAIEQVWAAHEAGAYSVAWHPDGTRLVSGSADGTVKVWAAATGQLLQTIQVGQPVWWAAWSPDGGRLAYGTEAGTPQIISVVPTVTN